MISQKNRNKIDAVFIVFNKFHATTASLEKPCLISETMVFNGMKISSLTPYSYKKIGGDKKQ